MVVATVSLGAGVSGGGVAEANPNFLRMPSNIHNAEGTVAGVGAAAVGEAGGNASSAKFNRVWSKFIALRQP